MANDFSTDSNCVALYRLENGAPTVDSKGSNTLTIDNAPVAKPTDYKEGSCSYDFENGSDQQMFRTDANLSSGFPFKYGESNNLLSVACWFKVEQFGDYRYLLSKYDAATNGRCWTMRVNVSGIFALLVGHGSTSLQTINLFTGLQTGRWYHVGLTINAITMDVLAILYDDSTGSRTKITETISNAMNAFQCPFCVGGSFTSGAPTNSSSWDGLIDEVVVFKDILTESEIDQIRQGVYSGEIDPPTAICDDIWAHWNFDQDPPGPLLDNSGNEINLTLESGSQADGIVGNSISEPVVSVTEEDVLFDPSENNPFTINLFWYPTYSLVWGEGDYCELSIQLYPGMVINLQIDTPALTLGGSVVAGSLYAEINPTISIDPSFIEAWHLITVRYYRLSLQLMIDGVVVLTAAGPTDITPDTYNYVSIQSTTYHAATEAPRVDEGSVFGRAMTDAEILEIWNSGIGGTFTCSPTYEYETNFEIIAGLFSTKTFIGDPAEECIVVPRGCKPLAEMLMADTPISAMEKEETPVSDLDQDDAPVSDLECEIM
jgi:hypothetical protein